jgi:hypothetical protein
VPVLARVQVATAQALAELEVHNISTAPKYEVSMQQLEAAEAEEAACEKLFQDMKEAVGAPRFHASLLIFGTFRNQIPSQQTC